MTETYKVGDKVRYTADNFGLGGAEGVVEEYEKGTCPAFVNFKSLNKTWWCSLAHLELIKEGTMEIPKVYKALMEVDGSLESLTTLGANLTYTEGQITYAPKDSMGIFVEETLKAAKSMGLGNKGYKKGGTLVIHEAAALGNQYLKVGDFYGCKARYPAILLGKEVWRDEPKEEPRPEPKFKVGDRVCFGGLKEVSTIKSVEWLGNRYAYYFNESSHFNSEEYLSLAPPKEEWVDVTKECEARIMGNHRVVLYHQHIEIMELSLSKPYIATTAPESAYKVEPTEAVLGFGEHGERQDFKVLKKVVK